MLVFAIIRTAYMAFRVDPRVQFPATATATLLIVDAWFDMTTSGESRPVLRGLVLALFVEIPAAVFSLYLARRVNRRVLELARLGRPGPRDGASPTAGAATRRRPSGDRRDLRRTRAGCRSLPQPTALVDAGHARRR